MFLNYENVILMRLKMRGFDFHQPATVEFHEKIKLRLRCVPWPVRKKYRSHSLIREGLLKTLYARRLRDIIFFNTLPLAMSREP